MIVICITLTGTESSRSTTKKTLVGIWAQSNPLSRACVVDLGTRKKNTTLFARFITPKPKYGCCMELSGTSEIIAPNHWQPEYLTFGHCAYLKVQPDKVQIFD